MPTVTIKKQKIYVGSKATPLISGEVHYWRLSPDSWKDCLRSVKQMGLTVVATYIPWEFHETSKKKYDFFGKTDPQRNLKAFLDLVQKEGLYLIIRPGPYIYSEWKNDGVPDHVRKYHRLHPQFKELSQHYIKAVLKVIQPYFATQPKGNIVLLQADNEIDPWPDLFGNQYGLGRKPGLYQEFLKKKYKSIQKLNQQWGTVYASFNEAKAFISAALENTRDYLLTGEKELKRGLDYFEFKHHYSYEFGKWIVDTYRNLGVDVPIYLNLYPFLYAHDWEKMNQISDLVGVDLYPYNELNEDVYEPRKVMDKIRYLRTFSDLPYIAEFESGVWHGRNYETGPFSPNHYRLLCLSVLLAGCQGWNWYMLVGRDNWYMSPINEWGEKRPELYDVFKQMVTVFKKIDVPSLEKITSASCTFNRMQYAVKSISSKDEVLQSLYEADVDYDFFDPLIKSIKKPILFYSGNQWLDQQSQKNLNEYVREGGVLVLFQNFPRKDDRFKNSDLLELHEPDSVLFEFKWNVSLSLSKKKPVSISCQPMVFGRVSGTPIKADLGSYGTQTVGYIKKVGKGKVLHLGVKPNRELMKHILDHFNITEPVQASHDGVKTAVYHKSGKYYVVIVNPTNLEQSCQIQLNLPNKSLSKAKNLLTNDVQSVMLNTVLMDLPRKDGVVLELS